MNKAVKESIKHVIICIVSSGLAGFLLAPGSIAANAVNLDLSGLMLPAIVFFIMRLGRRLSVLFLPNLAGNLLDSLLNGGSIALLVYFILMWVSNAQKIGGDVSDLINTVAIYLSVLIAGITFSMMASNVDEHEKQKIVSPVLAVIAKLTAGFALYGLLSSLESVVYTNIGMALFAGFIASAVASLFRYGCNAPNRYVSEFSKMISESAIGMFFVGGLIYSYIAFIRPLFSEDFTFTPLIEWGIVCLGAFWLYRRVRTSVQQIAVPERSLAVKKHAQQIEELVDLKIEKLGDIQKNFVENGRRPELLITLVDLLLQNRWEQDRIARILDTLINYEEPRIPWYASIWSQNSIEQTAREKRDTILRDIFAKITTRETKTQTDSEVENGPE